MKKAKLKDLVVVINGLTGKTKIDFESDKCNAKYIQFKNIHSPKIVESQLGNVYLESGESQNNILKNDIVMTGSSENIEEVGTTNINLLDMKNLYLNSFSYALRPTSIVNPLYLHYYLKSNNIRKQIILQGQGITRINLSPSRVLNIDLTIHEIHKQIKIGNLFSTMDKLIEDKEELIKSLSLEKREVSKKLLPRCTKNTNHKTLGSICKITTGKIDANAMVENGKYKFFTCAKETYSIDQYAFDCDALLISGNGSQVGHIHSYNGKFNAYQRTYVLSEFSYDKSYIYQYLLVHLKRRIDEEVSASNIPFIKMDTLHSLNIPSIEQKEQKKIGNLLSSMDKIIDLHKQELEQLKLKKKYYLNKIFN